MNPDYKEVFQEYFDEAIELGMSENDASEYATDKMTDYYADAADDYYDRMRDE